MYEAVIGAEEQQQRDIRIIAADGTDDRPLVESRFDDYLLGWMPDRSAVLFGSNRSGTYDVWVQAVSSGKPHGAPALLKRDIGTVVAMGFRGASLYYSASFRTSDIFIASLNGNEADRRALTLAESRANVLPAWSPDGTRIAYFSTSGYVQQPVYRSLIIREVAGDREAEFQTGIELRGPKAVWSTDSRSLLVFGKSKDGPGYSRIDTATGKAESLAKWDIDWFRGPSISADGGTAVHYRPMRGQPSRRVLYARNVTTGEDSVLHQVETPTFIQDAAVSPDGSQAALKHYSQQASILIIPTAGGTPREAYRGPAILRFDGITWSHDGRDVIFARQADSGGKAELWSIHATGGQPRKLGFSAAGLLSFDLHPDGRSLVYSVEGRRHHEISALENITASASLPRN